MQKIHKHAKRCKIFHDRYVWDKTATNHTVKNDTLT